MLANRLFNTSNETKHKMGSDQKANNMDKRQVYLMQTDYKANIKNVGIYNVDLYIETNNSKYSNFDKTTNSKQIIAIQYLERHKFNNNKVKRQQPQFNNYLNIIQKQNVSLNDILCYKFKNMPYHLDNKM